MILYHEQPMLARHARHAEALFKAAVTGHSEWFERYITFVTELHKELPREKFEYFSELFRNRLTLSAKYN